MGFATTFLKKQPFLKLKFTRAPKNSGLLNYIVIIPAFSEPEIFNTLNTIREAEPTTTCVEILILVNFSESCSDIIKQQNIELYDKLLEWSEINSNKDFEFTPVLAKNLPQKHAGAGLARKILMDNACERFNNLDNPDGIIFSLDADTLVPKNYFSETESFISANTKTDCFIFNFSHPISGRVFSPRIYDAICQYEIHLRYYKFMLKSIGYPYYHYTIGSCFAVKAKTYVKVGGMNKRKAGEDFYFLQKVFQVVETAFIPNIKLIPSPRPSWRVPFGTGPAVRKIASEVTGEFETYHPDSFHNLKAFLQIIPEFYSIRSEEYFKKIDGLPKAIRLFLLNMNAIDRIAEIKKNSASLKSFVKRFYHWFDAFVVLKYLNFAKENFFSSIEITKAVEEISETFNSNCSTTFLLEEVRKLDDDLTLLQ